MLVCGHKSMSTHTCRGALPTSVTATLGVNVLEVIDVQPAD